MSLFGSMMRDFDDDPLLNFGGHHQMMGQMRPMMFSNPFDSMMGNFGLMAPRRTPARGGMLMPFGGGGFPGFPDMNSMFTNMHQMTADPNCQVYSSSSVMSMNIGPDGQPQVYQATSSTRQAPGGVRETQKTVQDSNTGVRRMAIGHHLSDRGHVIEKEHNMYSGEQQENQEYINIEEEEAAEFNEEWQSRANRSLGALTYQQSHPSHRPTTTLAITQGPSHLSNRSQRSAPQHHLPPITRRPRQESSPHEYRRKRDRKQRSEKLRKHARVSRHNRETHI